MKVKKYALLMMLIFAICFSFSSVSFAYTPTLPPDHKFYNADDPSISFVGRWTRQTGTTYPGDVRKYSVTANDFAQFQVSNVSDVSLTFMKSYSQGIANIYVDNVLYSTVDMYDSNVMGIFYDYPITGLSPAIHTIKIVVTGTKNPLSINPYVMVFGYSFFRDTTPPDTPTGLTGTADIKSVSLSWTPNKETDLDGYNVFQNGIKLNTNLIKDNKFSLNNVTPDQVFAYQVSAVDRSGNESGKSSIVNLTALPDLPAIVLDAKNITSNSLELFWTGHVLGNSYDVYKGSTVIGNKVTNDNYDVSLLDPLTDYTFRVKGFDKYGRTFESNVITVMTTIPSLSNPIVNVFNLSHDSFKLLWSAVPYAESYKVFVKGVEVYSGTNNSYEATGLTPSTDYEYKVVAIYKTVSSETSGHVKTLAAPVPEIYSAKTELDPTDLSKRNLTYTASSDVKSVDVYVDGKLVGNYPVSQNTIQLDFSKISSIFADIKVDPVPSGKAFSFSSLAQTTGDAGIDEILSKMLHWFTVLKNSFGYITIPLIIITAFALSFFWTRRKFKRTAKVTIHDKPFMDTSNMKDSLVKHFEKNFTVDDMPNDPFPVPKYKPWNKMSAAEKLEFRSRKHQEKTGFSIVESKMVDQGGLFFSKPVEKLTYEKNGVKYVQTKVRTKGRGTQTVYRPKTFDDKVKHVSNQFKAVKSAFTGSNKKSKFH